MPRSSASNDKMGIEFNPYPHPIPQNKSFSIYLMKV